jgi:ABC-type nitrate/sulfonate/bicarbonate transport system permease component
VDEKAVQKRQKALPYAILLAVIILWQLLASTGITQPNRLPSPLSVLRGLLELFATGMPPGYTLGGHCLSSLGRVTSGVTLAVAFALPLGICMGYWRWLRDILHPFIEIIRPVPPLAWVPIAILWFGIGDTSASFIIFLGAFFPILLNTIEGALSINKRLIESAIILGAREKDLFFKVLLPGSTPSVVTGIRIGIGIGWMTVVAAEFTGIKSGYGLGYMIMTARDIQRPDLIVAGMVVIGVIGFSLDLIIKKIEQKMLRWR